MADGYWNRQPTMHPSAGLIKRPRSDYDLPPAHEMNNYLARDDDHGGRQVKDTKTIGSAYDRYLQNAQRSSFTSGEASNYGGLGRAARSGISAFSLADPVSMGRSGAIAPDLAPNGRGMAYDGRLAVDAKPARDSLDAMARPVRETIPLPPDASSTLYIEGLPPNSSRREVAHIFRPFVGYKEVRLVSKESRHRGGDPLILCFVDFINPACAATALSAIQGYKVDEHDPESPYLRLQFSKYPGPRSGSGPRGKR